MDCSMLGFPVHHQLLELAQTHVYQVSDAIQPSHPLSSSSPSDLSDLSQHQGLQMSQFFTTGGQSLEFQLQHQSFQWIFRTDFLYNWLVGSPCCPRYSQESFQYHRSKASMLQHLALFIVQMSHSYMTTGKTIALTRQTFVGKVMSLLFNMLSRLVITFLPRSQHLLISWMQSPSALILEPQKIKCVTVSIV